MPLTASDVEKILFAKKFMGYDYNEVDDFLHKIAESFTELWAEVASRDEKLALLQEQLAGYKSAEDSIKSTVLSAQQDAQGVLDDARAHAAEVIRLANEKADTILQDAQKARDESIAVKTQAVSNSSDILKAARKQAASLTAQADAEYKARRETMDAERGELIAAAQKDIADMRATADNEIKQMRRDAKDENEAIYAAAYKKLSDMKDDEEQKIAALIRERKGLEIIRENTYSHLKEFLAAQQKLLDAAGAREE